jgi:hypothetical protein
MRSHEAFDQSPSDEKAVARSAWESRTRLRSRFMKNIKERLARRAREALRRGAKWIVDTTAGLYSDDRLPAEPNPT